MEADSHGARQAASVNPCDGFHSCRQFSLDLSSSPCPLDREMQFLRTNRLASPTIQPLATGARRDRLVLWPRGILLYGPPGNGKTLLVKALASQSNSNFISIKGPELLSKYIGESEQGVRELFARARHAAPCVVFLDEVDALAPKRRLDGRSPVTDRVVSQLLTELDGVEALGDVWVIAATNRPDMIDDALLRPGRLDYHLEVARPDRAARAAILGVHLRKKPIAEGIDLAALAELTEGLSAAEVRFVCDRAALSAIRRVFPATSGEAVDIDSLRIEQGDFDEALAARAGASGRAPHSQADRL